MGDSGDRAREEFFSEAQEIVESLGRDLLALDEAQRAGRPDPDLVNDVFRAVHTLKGLAGLFGANRMSTLSHELEGLLDDLRLGRVELTDSVLALLFRSVELYGRLLQAEKDGREPPIAQIDELIRELHRSGPASQPPSAIGDYQLDPGLLAVLTEYEEHRLRTNIAQGLALYRLRVHFQLQTIDQALDDLKALAKPHGEIITYLPTGAGADADSIELDILMASRTSVETLRESLPITGIEIDEIPRQGGAGDDKRPSPATGQPAPPRATPTPAQPIEAISIVPAPYAARAEAHRPSAKPEVASIRSVAQTVRVDIHKLDRLMNIVGELAIVRTSLTRLVDRLRGAHDRELAADLHRLQRTFDRHLGAMQQGILEVRMVPLGQVFDKLARVVRQISREADKQVNLVITGAETEVDKLIVEELSDPLMHMMRNAIDHGIEPRPEREAVGKPALGTIALNAFQKGNHVVIEIEDDGRGINAERVLEAAIKRGDIGPEDVRSTSRREVLNLVFLPGVSTKQDVSELSGRGVGMDVVKTNISKLGGIIDVQSETGIGTKFTITLPITLAIISALMVRVADQVFALPLANVDEAVILDPHGVRRIEGREVVTLRGATLQLCSLMRLYGLSETAGSASAPMVRLGSQPLAQAQSYTGRSESQQRRQYVVVISVGQPRLGLVVDAVIGEQDVVIKALGPSLKQVRGFAGATELGDQRIALVLDAPALIEEMNVGAERGRIGSDARG